MAMAKWLLSVMLLLFELSGSCLSASEVEALLALKSKWEDPQGYLANWTTKANNSPCSWRGISCQKLANNSHVVNISLPGALRGGILGPEIGFISELQVLVLSNNGFNGAIAAQITQLKKLNTLDLSVNNFTGEIPRNITDLSSLKVLNLAFNRLEGPLPDELGNLSSMQHLNLKHNFLNGSIPRGLSRCKELRYLMLENNNLSGEIPPGLGLLPHLYYLAIENNSLTGEIPEDFVNLTQLLGLYAGQNQLNGTIPDWIGNLTSLTRLHLQGNQLTGQIPSSIGSLQDLTELLLSFNHLNGKLPPEIVLLRNLSALKLSNNNLTGDLPRSLGSLLQLQELDLEANRIGGNIDGDIEKLYKLQTLNFASNGFQGPIPLEIGRLSSLVNLFLQQNDLSGKIPQALGSLASLQRLNLSYNNLTGEVPRDGVFSKFQASSFVGNPGLCGAPLRNSTCSAPDKPGPSPPLSHDTLHPYPRKSNSQKNKIIFGVVSGVVSLFILLVLLLILIPRRKRKVQAPNRLPDIHSDGPNSRMQMFVVNFRYTYEQIVYNAGYYDTAHVLGKGRFATVYRSTLPDGTQLAVKVFKYLNIPAAFEKEIETLATAKHRYLLPIRGYYSSPMEKAIFYEFMPKGTLYDLLHAARPDSSTLPDWPTRHRIALGAAQALAYLHRGSSFPIIHKDFKSSNILLDANMSPVVSDFGLAELVYNISQGALTVIETSGYAAPEVISTKRHTEKSDVYSFGVVLLELITGKKPVSRIEEGDLNLVGWVIRLHEDGRGKELMDPKVVDTSPFPDILDKALRLAVLSLKENPVQRPTMSEIAAILESLLANPSPLRSPEMRMDKPLLL